MATGNFVTNDVSKSGAIVSAFSWGLDSPRDSSTGMATGKRRYDRLTITRAPSMMTIQILNAISRNELLKTVTLTTTTNGVSRKMTLFNANIVSYKESMDVNGPLETFTIVYSKIEQEYGNRFLVDDVLFNVPASVPATTTMLTAPTLQPVNIIV